MGKNAKFFITGDITQVDLPRRQQSGLILATKILKDVKGIDFIYLDNADVVRHHLVTKIIKCYEQWENRKEERADNRAEDDVKDE
jgi:phosphate starvation-inducible PhoH-like protein